MPDTGVPDEIREAIEEGEKLAELQARVERSWALRFEGMLARRSRGVVVIVGLLLLALIGLIDASSGGFAVEVFYLVPIGLVTFGRGRGLGLLFAGVAAIAWGAVEIFQDVTSLEASVTYWNALTRFWGFAAVALLIAPMREAMVIQRQIAERETEAVDQMRAMEELREAALYSREDPGAETIAVGLPSEVVEANEPDADRGVQEEPGSAGITPGEVGALPEAEGPLLDALSDLERDARRERRAPSGA